jgi:hypothetical protein
MRIKNHVGAMAIGLGPVTFSHQSPIDVAYTGRRLTVTVDLCRLVLFSTVSVSLRPSLYFHHAEGMYRDRQHEEETG